MDTKKGIIVWLTGLSGAGKTTLANALSLVLSVTGKNVEHIDGDEIRRVMCPDLSFSKKDRDENVRRMGHLASLLAKHGVTVIVSAISPYREIRNEVRRDCCCLFIEVYVNAPLAVCEERDVKGLYRRARTGDLQEFTGVSNPYEPPLNPELEVRTDLKSIEDCVVDILAKIPDDQMHVPKLSNGAPFPHYRDFGAEI